MAASNTILDRYNITNFIKYTDEAGFMDFDFYHNPNLFKITDFHISCFD